MFKIEIAVTEIESAGELFKIAEEDDNIDIITEKNFNGDITTIELYISLALSTLAVIVPIIKAMIKKNKVSSLKLNGDKIEIENVSQELIEKILVEKGLLKKDELNEDGDVILSEIVDELEENTMRA